MALLGGNSSSIQFLFPQICNKGDNDVDILSS